jgi:hypothetical protein
MMSDLYKKGVGKVLWTFYQTAISRRLPEVFLRQETLLAVVLGVASAFIALPHADLSGKISDICVAYVGYAAIALGFCVGGITVALTLPAPDFVKKLANLTLPERGDALSSLFFVFCWTAVVHWISIVAFILVLLFDGHSDVAVFTADSIHYRILRGCMITLASYALFQFLITVLTLWQVGTRYIETLQTPQNSTSPDPAPKT